MLNGQGFLVLQGEAPNGYSSDRILMGEFVDNQFTGNGKEFYENADR